MWNGVFSILSNPPHIHISTNVHQFSLEVMFRVIAANIVYALYFGHQFSINYTFHIFCFLLLVL
jgi:hypothetical protein